MIPHAPVGEILRWLDWQLAPGSDSPGLDAQVLLSHVLGCTRSWVLTHPEARLSPNQVELLEGAVARLDQAIPLPYVLGHWEFFGLDFVVTPDTLIPRPETELLVERALEWLEVHPSRLLAADVGTGSGCIAVTLARRVPGLKVLASDISLPALRIALRNAARYAVSDRIDFVNASLLAPIKARFDLICANLPYIPTLTLRELKVFGKEPDLALNGGPDGMDLIRKLLRVAPGYLAPGGLLLMEIDKGQSSKVKALAGRLFPDARIEIQRDLAGLDRLLSVQTRSSDIETQ